MTLLYLKLVFILITFFIIIKVKSLDCSHCRKIQDEFPKECTKLISRKLTTYCYINNSGCYFSRGDFTTVRDCVLTDSLVICTGTVDVPILNCGLNEEQVGFSNCNFLQNETVIELVTLLMCYWNCFLYVFW